MSLETSFGIVTILIFAAAYGGYVVSQIKQAALLEQLRAADRDVIIRLREAVIRAEEDAQQLTEDLDHCIQQLHVYEQAWYGQPVDQEQSGDPLLHPADTDIEPRQDADFEPRQDGDPEFEQDSAEAAIASHELA